jgi:hypothetical protein
VLIIGYLSGASKLPEIKEDYDAALASANRADALEAGRRYYSAKRYGAKLTAADEQAITNDLMAMPKTPQPFVRQKDLPRSKKIMPVDTPVYMWIVGGIVVLLAIVLIARVLDQGSVNTPVVEEVPSQVFEETGLPYEVLSEDRIGTSLYKNLNVSTKDTVVATKNLPSFIHYIKQLECNGIQCNTISLWDSKQAYYKYDSKKDDPKWRKKNWVKICEANLAYYVVTVGEIDLFPLLDDEYRKWGGKKKRPKQHIYKIE